MLQSIGPNLWCVERRRRRAGLSDAERTSIVRLSTGELLLYCPTERPDRDDSEWAELGPIGFLVLPNLWSKLDVAAWRARRPGLRVLVPPEWTGGHRGVCSSDASGVGGDGAEAIVTFRAAGARFDALMREVEPKAIDGIARLGEWVLRHEASGALLVGDLVRGSEPGASTVRRLMRRVSLGPGPLATSRDLRWMVSDRRALRASLDSVSRWTFERVVPRVGGVVTDGGRAAWLRAFQWVEGRGAYWE